MYLALSASSASFWRRLSAIVYAAPEFAVWEIGEVRVSASIRSLLARSKSYGIRSNQGDGFINIVGDDDPCVLSEVEFSFLVRLIANGRACPSVSTNNRSDLELPVTRRAEDYWTTGEPRVIVPVQEVRLAEQRGDRKALYKGHGMAGFPQKPIADPIGEAQKERLLPVCQALGTGRKGKRTRRCQTLGGRKHRNVNLPWSMSNRRHLQWRPTAVFEHLYFTCRLQRLG